MSAPPRLSRPLECVVCGSHDARTLSTTTLASGAVVIVCGSHALAHGRLSGPARSASDLRAMLGERRSPSDRRDEGTDELARDLALAFNPERRAAGRRREDAYSAA
jgi:hypothetical protein